LPYAIKPAGKGLYKVVNTATGRVHAKGTTKAKAQRQLTLLNGLDEGFIKPEGKKRGKV
jgi:hypothetical protein